MEKTDTRVEDASLYRDDGTRDSITPHYSAPPSNRVKPLLEFLDGITPQEPKITPQDLLPEEHAEANASLVNLSESTVTQRAD